MNECELKRLLSSRLRKWIRENGYSYRGLARKAGVADSTVVKWANGSMIPRGMELRKLCVETGLSADYLLGLDGE